MKEIRVRRGARRPSCIPRIVPPRTRHRHRGLVGAAAACHPANRASRTAELWLTELGAEPQSAAAALVGKREAPLSIRRWCIAAGSASIASRGNALKAPKVLGRVLPLTSVVFIGCAPTLLSAELHSFAAVDFRLNGTDAIPDQLAETFDLPYAHFRGDLRVPSALSRHQSWQHGNRASQTANLVQEDACATRIVEPRVVRTAGN